MMRLWQTIPTGWRVAIVFFVGLIVLGRLETNNETTGLVTLVVLAGVGYRVWEKVRPTKQINTPPPVGSLTLGHDPDGRPVFLSEQQLAAHGLILGATGSGKTTSLLAILCEEIQRGRPMVAIDLKGSQSFADQLAYACQVAGRPFHWWRPEGPMHWNPLGYGDATELKDKLISAETFTEPHYQRAAERYLQTAIQVLIAAAPDRPVSLGAVVGLMDPNNLKALLQHVPKELMGRVGPYLTGLSRDQQSAILGLQSRLGLLSESQVGGYLQPGNPQLDLYRALGGSTEAILFSLNSSRYGKLSAQLAAMIIQDLITVSGHRLSQYDRPLAIVAIDEFSALDADNLLHLLARAREAGISVLLSTQELADVERLCTGFRDQVLGNTALLLAHRQNVPDSAELIAKMIGTDTIWKQTYQTQSVPHSRLFGNSQGWQGTGLGTAREVEEFRVHPNTIKELSTGRAILITKLPTSHATQVRVDPWRPNGHAN